MSVQDLPTVELAKDNPMTRTALVCGLFLLLAFSGKQSTVFAGSFNVTVNCPHDFEVAVVHIQNNSDHVEGKGWHKIEARKNRNFGYGKMETNETFWVFVRRVDDKRSVIFKELDDRAESSKELVDIRVMKARFPNEKDGHLSWRSDDLRDQITGNDNFSPNVWGNDEYTVLRVRAARTNYDTVGTIILEEDGHVNYKSVVKRTYARGQLPGDKEIQVKQQRLEWAANWEMP